MGSSPMKKLVWRFYYADRKGFIWPGIYYSYGKNRRIIPLPMTKTARQFARSPLGKEERKYR